MAKRFKRHKDIGLFDQDFRLEKLSKLGDPLERLNSGIDFEIFREILENSLIKLAKGKGGRPPYDYVLMFKILILQRFYNLSDDQVEYQVCDRLSFMRFLNLTISDDVPDSKTVWNFREQLTDLNVVEKLFARFILELESLSLIINEGKIIDASFVEVPKQRNNREDNKTIKSGEIPEKWKTEDNINKLAQKDVDARWTKKNFENFYGYKNHILIDSVSKFITAFIISSASVHDSQVVGEILGDKDKGQDFYADSAYLGEDQEKIYEQHELKTHIIEKGYKNKPLTEEQKKNNIEKSRVRVRVEHIFGFMEKSMNRMYLHAVGAKRIESAIGMMNLTYNMFRKIQIA